MKLKALALTCLFILFSTNAFSELKKGSYECDNQRKLNIGFDAKTLSYNFWFSYQGGFAGSYSAVPFIFKLNSTAQLSSFSMEKTGLKVGRIAISKFDKYSILEDMIVLYFEENLDAVKSASFNNPVNPKAVVTCTYSDRLSVFDY